MQILGHGMHVSHIPYPSYINEKHDHGVRQIRVLDGYDICCIEKAPQFYNEILDIPIHVVNSIEVAELCKIIENSNGFMEIAFTEELKMFCDRSGISFELLFAINTKWNIKVLEAKQGIGGHCLSMDSQTFLTLLKNVLDVSIIEADKKVD